MHNTVQRGANYLTELASFDTGSDGLLHRLIISTYGNAGRPFDANDTDLIL